MSSSIWIAIAAQLFSLLVGIFSYRKRSVSLSGLIALLTISSLFIWLQEIAFLFILFYMFASSSILSHYKKPHKELNNELKIKCGPRDYIQAISNLGIATVLLLIYHFTGENMLVACIIGSVAAANADSWASEIGSASNKQAIMITTFKPAPKGMSGAITMAGTLGGILGSLFIVCASMLTLQWLSNFQGNFTFVFWSSFSAGIAGLFIDSYLGAIFQSLYKTKDQLSEMKEGNSELVKGFHWINNDMVNLLTTVAGAAIAGLIYWILI